MSDFEANVANDCPNGCESDLSMHDALRAQHDGAELVGRIGIAMMVAGGLVTATGVGLQIMNRPRRVLPTLEVAPRGGVTARIQLRF